MLSVTRGRYLLEGSTTVKVGEDRNFSRVPKNEYLWPDADYKPGTVVEGL